MKLINLLLRITENIGCKFYNFLVSSRRKPIQNLLTLLLIFLVLHINNQCYSGCFIFEVELLNEITLHLGILIPSLLFLNSFLFRRIWAQGLSGLIFFVPAFIFDCIIYPTILPNGLSHEKLVRRSNEPQGYVISVYEYTTHGFHDNGYICRAWVRQKKCFMEFSGIKN